MEQVLRSQRQCVNTFDSIQDLILVHDAEFNIMKVNQALVQRLNLAPAAVVGNPCESLLPRSQEQWKGCPYCSRGDVDFVEGSDPCFGGYSLVSTSSYTDQNSKQKGTTLFATPRIAEPRRRNTDYSSSRYKKASSSRLPMAAWSIAMTPSSRCSATPHATS
jgi:hypothetical protein